MLRSLLMNLTCLGVCWLIAESTASGQTPTGDQLPETEPLVMEEPLDVVMVRGINRFAERELAASRERREAKWNRDYSSVDAYLKSIDPHRQRLREMIGASRAPASSPFLFGEAEALDGGGDRFVRWDVGEGISASGILLISTSVLEDDIDDTEIDPQNLLDMRGLVVLIPDSSQTPEELVGMVRGPGRVNLGIFEDCATLVVARIDRSDELSGHPDVRYTNLTHREFVYRTGFELGLHPIGFEVDIVRQAARSLREWSHLWLTRRDLPCGVAGIGDGGLVALYASAVDPSFDSTYVAGYFNERENVWQEPIDRNVFGLLTEFGDADLASLIAPRPLIIDRSAPPTSDGPPAAREGRLAYAAPGRVTVPDTKAVLREFDCARIHYERLDVADNIQQHYSRFAAPKHVSHEGLEAFFKSLSIENPWPRQAVNVSDLDPDAYDVARQKRLVDSLVRHTQMTLHRSDKVREKFWKDADRSNVETWVETSQKYRDYIHDHMIGRLPLPTAPLNPRSRKVIDETTHMGWEVVLDVFPGGVERGELGVESQKATSEDEPTLNTTDPGVIAGGILLLPKDLQPGEQRPVVVCQHGLEGVPMDTITTDESQRAWGAYKGFSTQLVKRGFIIYAPQNPYKGEDEFRVIQRKSNPLGRSLFSYIIEQHRQTLTWLATLPYVDPERIAFYGLSYGGKTAVRVPPLLKNTAETSHPEYCLSICSADFNEWIRKNCSAEDRYSYVFTKEYEMFEWNMGHIAGYAELASLMAPRPFMVERGHDDGVAPDEWVAWEFAKVRRHYDKLGIGDRAEIEWFNGPHTINGQGTFRFLHKHLNWPEPR
ncbi:MAG: hypothetical protein KDA75_09930 [Planctomycetaceae bacterium]|nr:hypothetical protein [Planctomycetaceae bacterium]